jgi:cbb3-type cytochrome oxidase subunit 3
MDELIRLITAYGLYLGLPLVFLGIVIWVFRPSARKRYEAGGKLPFQDDPKRDKMP